MKKRLDIQSLLENSEKQDLVLFLKNAFALHPDLTDHFLIHFASRFELDETEFQSIMDRIQNMIPGNLSGMTHRKANKIRDHLKDLIEQARDCLSREDYRQAFVIVSHVLRLLDEYSDLIAEKFRFKALLDQSYRLLDSIYQESPAPELKTKMQKHLHDLILHGKAIPWENQLNPYMILIEWGKDKPQNLAKKLMDQLQKKIERLPQFRRKWIEQKVLVLQKLNMDGELLKLAGKYDGEMALYHALARSEKITDLNPSIVELLRRQYARQEDRTIKSQIFQILQHHSVESPDFSDLALQEFFVTGDLNILTQLLQDPQICEQTLVEHLSSYSGRHHGIEAFHLYAAYKHLHQDDLLIEALMTEKNIYEILPFLDIVYPKYRKEVEQKLATLIEDYLGSHFGRPALNHINGILDEINRRGQRELNRFLIRTIECQFGHRKHFQKLMKELVV